MNKYLLFLIIVLMSSLCYAQVLKGGSASLAREQPAISIDAEANTAQVVYSKASIGHTKEQISFSLDEDF